MWPARARQDRLDTPQIGDAATLHGGSTSFPVELRAVSANFQAKIRTTPTPDFGPTVPHPCGERLVEQPPQTHALAQRRGRLSGAHAPQRRRRGTRAEIHGSARPMPDCRPRRAGTWGLCRVLDIALTYSGLDIIRLASFEVVSTSCPTSCLRLGTPRTMCTCSWVEATTRVGTWR